MLMGIPGTSAGCHRGPRLLIAAEEPDRRGGGEWTPTAGQDMAGFFFFGGGVG